MSHEQLSSNPKWYTVYGVLTPISENGCVEGQLFGVGKNSTHEVYVKAEADAVIERLQEELRREREVRMTQERRAPVEPSGAPADEHDAGIIRDLEAMASNKSVGFWPQALAIGALRLIRQRASVPPVDAQYRRDLRIAFDNWMATNNAHVLAEVAMLINAICGPFVRSSETKSGSET